MRYEITTITGEVVVGKEADMTAEEIIAAESAVSDVLVTSKGGYLSVPAEDDGWIMFPLRSILYVRLTGKAEEESP